jgi:hypothetical protein
LPDGNQGDGPLAGSHGMFTVPIRSLSSPDETFTVLEPPLETLRHTHCGYVPSPLYGPLFMVLLWPAGNHPLHSRQRRRQALPAGMRALGLGARAGGRLFPLALGLDLSLAATGLLFQQLQLEVRQLFASRAILVQSLQTKPLFQQLYLLLGVLQLTKLIADRVEQRRRKVVAF